jgi:hypothetical protein
MVSNVYASGFFLWSDSAFSFAVFIWHGIKMHIDHVVSNSVWIIGSGEEEKWRERCTQRHKMVSLEFRGQFKAKVLKFLISTMAIMVM